MTCLFTNIHKQYNIWKVAKWKGIQTSQVNTSRILLIKNVKFSRYCFNINPNIREIYVNGPLITNRKAF